MRALLLALAVLATPLTLAAQDSLFVPGTRIRVKQLGRPATVVGTVVGTIADTLVLNVQRHPEPVRLPLIQIKSIELSRGHKSGGSRGFLYGALVGLGAGALIGGAACASWCAEECNGLCGALIISLPTAILGGLIGAATARERWQAVPKPQ